MDGDRERLLGAAFDGYVSKPVAPGKLLEAMAFTIPAQGIK